MLTTIEVDTTTETSADGAASEDGAAVALGCELAGIADEADAKERDADADV